MRQVRICAAILVVITALAVTAPAQQAKPAPPAKEPSYKDVLVKSDSWVYKNGHPEIVTLTGNVVITQGDTVLTADKIVYNEDDKVQTAVATGHVKITDPQTEITGDQGSAFFNDKRSVIEGSVKVIVKPKEKPEDKDTKTARSQFKDKATITCDKIEYFYKKKEATASGNLTVLQKDRTLTAGSLFYQVKDEKLTLSGGVNVRDSKGQTLAGPSCVASLKEGAESLEMEHAVGTFKVKSEEEGTSAK